MKTSPVTEQQNCEQREQGSTSHSLTLAVVSLAIFLDALDVSIVTIALPNIQQDLQLTTTELQWVPGIYVLTYAGFQLLGGGAADLLGRRLIFLLGATLFGVASLMAGLAPSGWLLILARGGQGIGAALTFPAAVSILTTTFAEGPKRNKALGVFSAMGAAGFTGGVILGGVVTTSLSWHWIFFLNIPFMLLILLFSRLVVLEDRPPTRERRYDLAGAVTVTAGLLLLVYALTQAQEEGANMVKTGGLVALTILILLCFLLIERWSKAPLMPLSILRSRTLFVASVASLALQGSVFGFLFIYTLSLQEVHHFSPVNTSLTLVPASIASALIGLFVAPWSIHRLGIRFTGVLGLLCLSCGIMLFWRTGEAGNYTGAILPSVVLALAGAGLAGPTLSVSAISGIAPKEQGLAAGLQGTFLQAGGGLGLAITTVVIAASLAFEHGIAHTSIPEITAQSNSYHTGLLVAAGGAILGALIALVGLKIGPTVPSND
ncbi:MFS transporter [Dictyobacter sp. S3.2.2.5]|uniref:MFS transporter n=1 Tax=Dictyobacter halimunensis TaxID=3026934 RepID=A0ABQ6FJN5_9CHLR|nr:MFS transporter [Dictyobacter sp. S3.2.2.5]